MNCHPPQSLSKVSILLSKDNRGITHLRCGSEQYVRGYRHGTDSPYGYAYNMPQVAKGPSQQIPGRG